MPRSHVRLVACAALVAAAQPAVAMSAGEFIAKVDGIKARAPFSLFGPDMGLLKREGEIAVKAWYAQAQPPGRAPNACPPKGPLKISNGEFLGFIQAVPPPQRASTSVSQAITTALNRRYPCTRG